MSHHHVLGLGLFMAFFLSTPTVGLSHPGHATLMEAELDGRRLEVTVRLQRSDLERVLGTMKPARPLDALVQTVIKRAVQLKNAQGGLVPLEWVGLEEKGFLIWVYFQWTLAGPIEGHALTHRLFFDLHPTTIHTVNLRTGKKRASLTFRRTLTTQTLPSMK